MSIAPQLLTKEYQLVSSPFVDKSDDLAKTMEKVHPTVFLLEKVSGYSIMTAVSKYHMSHILNLSIRKGPSSSNTYSTLVLVVSYSRVVCLFLISLQSSYILFLAFVRDGMCATYNTLATRFCQVLQKNRYIPIMP